MRALAIVACLVGTCSAARATDYFLDSERGSDDSPGTSEAAPLRTLAALAALAFQPGDVVRLKRGSTFRGRLQVQGNGDEGKPIRLATYGEGPKPEILGSVTLDGWEQHTGEVYKASVPADSFVGQRRVHSVFEYDGGVPVRLLRADAHDGTRPGFNDGHGDLDPLLIEDPGHPDLLSDQSGHLRSPSVSRL